MEDLLTRAKALVKQRIPGTRKGSDEPAYIHSTRVSDALARFGYSDEVVIAGMLHDIVEDGATTLENLRDFGFGERILDLVDLCTHDEEIEGGDARWVKMMAGLIDAKDKQAWAIKLADLTDNMKSSDTLTADRQKFMREAKGPFLLRLAYNEMGDTPVWEALKTVILSLRGAEATKQS